MSPTKKEKSINSFNEQMQEYHQCSQLIRKNWAILLKVSFVLVIQFTAQFSVAYFIYLALGQQGMAFLEIFFLQIIIYTASAFIPLPGAVGINESIFVKLFGGLYATGLISSAMLLNRGITFYMLLLICGCSLIAFYIHDAKKNRIKK